MPHAKKNYNRASLPSADLESNTCNEQVGKEKIKRLDTPCRIHVHNLRYRLTDADGISAKAVIDGIVLAGVLSDDSPSEVQKVSYSQEKIPKNQQEKTIITIEEVK